MPAGYALAYRFGLTPWEKAGRDAAVQFNALLDREQEGDPRRQAGVLECSGRPHPHLE
jgi:hypothetical protein